ncbi:MAG: hypothetical protein WC840_07335, partial [Candidatus Peribacteraceae bacterium]
CDAAVYDGRSGESMKECKPLYLIHFPFVFSENRMYKYPHSRPCFFEDGSYFKQIWIAFDGADPPLLQLRQPDR